jgi:hypothetical protein
MQKNLTTKYTKHTKDGLTEIEQRFEERPFSERICRIKILSILFLFRVFRVFRGSSTEFLRLSPRHPASTDTPSGHFLKAEG